MLTNTCKHTHPQEVYVYIHTNFLLEINLSYLTRHSIIGNDEIALSKSKKNAFMQYRQVTDLNVSYNPWICICNCVYVLWMGIFLQFQSFNLISLKRDLIYNRTVAFVVFHYSEHRLILIQEISRVCRRNYVTYLSRQYKCCKCAAGCRQRVPLSLAMQHLTGECIPREYKSSLFSEIHHRLRCLQ